MSVTDALARKTAYTYDSKGNILTVTRLATTPQAVTTTYTYDPVFNQVTSVTDPLNHAITFGYDPKGNLTSITNALNKATILTVNTAGQPLTIKDPLNNITTFTYDQGDLVKVTDPINRETNRFIDAAGRLRKLLTLFFCDELAGGSLHTALRVSRRLLGRSPPHCRRRRHTPISSSSLAWRVPAALPAPRPVRSIRAPASRSLRVCGSGLPDSSLLVAQPGENEVPSFRSITAAWGDTEGHVSSRSRLCGIMLRRALPNWSGLVAFVTIPLGILFIASWHLRSGATLGDSRGLWIFLLPYILHAVVAGLGMAADRKGRVTLAIATTLVLGLGLPEAQADFKEMSGMAGRFCAHEWHVSSIFPQQQLFDCDAGLSRPSRCEEEKACAAA